MDKRKFKDLTAEERSKLVEFMVHHTSLEVWDDHQKLWCQPMVPVVSMHGIYRIPKTKPSVDWSHLSSEFKYLTRDEAGCGYVYTDRPDWREGMWVWPQATAKGFGRRIDNILASYKPGNCLSRESLVVRPEK